MITERDIYEAGIPSMTLSEILDEIRATFWAKLGHVGMRYSVQFVLPVDNPEDNVRKTVKKGGYRFEVPINHKDAHTMGFQQLIEAAERCANVHNVHRA